jgi:putative transposase
MLRTDGHVKNHKRTYRIYCEEGLQVRTKRRKKLYRPRVPMIVPDGPNQRWSVDFVSDQLANGRRFRVFNVVDDYSREPFSGCRFLDQRRRLARELDQLASADRCPERIVMDNGPELTSKAMFFWSQRTGVKLHFIQPGKPTQNAFVESFNGKFREYCLNLNWFASLEDARSTIDAWRHHYNYETTAPVTGQDASSGIRHGGSLISFNFPHSALLTCRGTVSFRAHGHRYIKLGFPRD